MGNDCIFCKIVKGEIPLEKVICDNDNFLSIPDTNPITEGHSIIISKKHFSTILDMPNTAGDELLSCIKDTAIKIMGEKNADGFNIINNNFEAAGQLVNHVHFHIIPRKKGDGLKLN